MPLLHAANVALSAVYKDHLRAVFLLHRLSEHDAVVANYTQQEIENRECQLRRFTAGERTMRSSATCRLLTRDGHLDDSPLLCAVASPGNVQIPVHLRSTTMTKRSARTPTVQRRKRGWGREDVIVTEEMRSTLCRCDTQ
jgi:hypothetical protein